MLWTIGLNIGEAFAEIVAKSGDMLHHHRWNLLSKSLRLGTEEFLKAHEIHSIKEMRITSQVALHFMEKDLGQAAAFLVTRGFEEWLQIEHARKHIVALNQTQAPKALPFINRDLIFPIHERIAASGEIVVPLNLKEIEPICARLKLLEVDSVVLGLLNASTNDEHERILGDYLVDEGFQVISSSQFQRAYKGNLSEKDEKERWLGALKEAYLKSAYSEFLKDFLSSPAVSSLHNDGQLHFIDSFNFNQQWPSVQFTDSYWTTPLRLKDTHPDLPFLYLGLERWYGYFPTLGRDWAVAENLRHQENLFLLPVQPTQPLQVNHWGLPITSSSCLGFSPGPIALGRGNQLTPFDLFFIKGFLEKIEGIPVKDPRKANLKIIETLNVLSNQDSRKRYDQQTLATEILISLFFQIAPLWKTESKISVYGPMAPALSLLFQQTPFSKQFNIVDKSQYVATDVIISDGEVYG